jgi:hypothetical protein
MCSPSRPTPSHSQSNRIFLGTTIQKIYFILFCLKQCALLFLSPGRVLFYTRRVKSKVKIKLRLLTKKKKYKNKTIKKSKDKLLYYSKKKSILQWISTSKMVKYPYYRVCTSTGYMYGIRWVLTNPNIILFD